METLTETYPKTFFAFEPPAKKDPKVASNVSPPQSKREVKKEQKKKSKKQSIWNLMPYVDETQLDHSLAAESGISRLWEDESVHLSMRNLRVGEAGLITKQKELHTL